MSTKKINIGCGPDLKEGWVNTDNNASGDWKGTEFWDITQPAPEKWHGQFDFALVNHTLCLLSYDDVDKALLNIKQVLKEGGILEVIDMDVKKAIQCWEHGDEEGLPGDSENIDERMCKHLVGYGRKSIYTLWSMAYKLNIAGFVNMTAFTNSKHDLRPKESLIIQGTK